MIRSLLQSVLCIALCPLLAAQQVAAPATEQPAKAPIPASATLTPNFHFEP